MKHLLNNMPEWEKNSIREQHKGGMNIDISRFKKLLESKLGDSKPLISEEGDPTKINTAQNLTKPKPPTPQQQSTPKPPTPQQQSTPKPPTPQQQSTPEEPTEKKVTGSGTEADPYLIKFFEYKDDMENNSQRSGNLEVFDLKMANMAVEFSHKLAGQNKVNKGFYLCDRGNKIYVEETFEERFISDDAKKIFQTMCDKFVSTGSKIPSDLG